MLELRADTIEAQQRAAAGLAAQVMAAAVQQLAECRQLWPGGVDTAARLEAAIQALGGTPPAPARDSLYALGQRDRRAAVCDSAAGVKPGRAPGVPSAAGLWPNQWPPGGRPRKAAAWPGPPPR